MKKRIAFLSYNLDIGGIETSLVSLLKNLDYDKYDITLFLDKKEGIFLSEIPEQVKVIDLGMAKEGNMFVRKTKNLMRLLYFKFKYNNKFDFSACYATTISSCNKLAYHFSKNNAIWVHGNYTLDLETDKELDDFIDFININKYKNIVFVSNSIKENMEKRGCVFAGKSFVFNNLIDYEKILKLADEENIQKRKTTLINVSRHEEKPKQLLMLLDVIKRLKNENYDFDLWLIGDGPDHTLYTDYVRNNELEDIVKFFGKKSNPFCYYKAADGVVLTSRTEGNPVVFVEARVLNKPLITTKVSDALLDIDGKYGIVTDFDADSYYEGLKKFLDEGYISEKFDPREFNENILRQLMSIIDGE